MSKTKFTCNVCGGHEERQSEIAAYVCPWCGEGVMQPEGDEREDLWDALGNDHFDVAGK